MATQTEILEIKLDIDDLTKSVEEGKKGLKDLNKEQKELEKQGKNNSKQFTDNAKKIDVLKTANQQNTKALKNQTIANNAATGSNEKLKAQLSLQTTAYNKLSREQRNSSKEGKELKSSIKGISDELKGNEEIVGDNRRSVGNYGDALQSLPGPLGGAVAGIKAMTTAGLAFIATPIGLVVAALALAVGALTTFFKSSEDGQNKLNRISNTLSATWKVMTDLVANLGEIIFNAFSNPKELLADFANFIKQNLINRFTAFKVILEGIINLDFQQIADGAIQAATGVENATSKMVDGFNSVTESLGEIGDKINENIGLANLLSDIQETNSKQEREFLVENAGLNRDISAAKVIAGDKENKDAITREAAIRRAISLTERQLEINQILAQNRVDTAAAESKQGLDAREDLEEQAAAAAALIDVEVANNGIREGLINMLQGIITEADAQRAELELEAEMRAVNADTATEERNERSTANLIGHAKRRQKARDEESKATIKTSKLTTKQILADAAEETRVKGEEAEKQKVIDNLVLQNKLSGVRSGFDSVAAATAEGTAVNKAAGIASATISTFQGATAGYASLAGIPLVGPALGAIAAGVIVAAGLVNISKIASAESGGVFHGDHFGAMRVGGHSHADGGTKYYGEDGNRFEVERGEIITVLNRRSAGLINNLSDLNQLGGGVSFGAQGGGRYQDGGIALSAASAGNIDGVIQQQRALNAQLENQPPSVVFVEDIRSGVEAQVQVESIAQA